MREAWLGENRESAKKSHTVIQGEGDCWVETHPATHPQSRNGCCPPSPGLTACGLNSFPINMLPLNLPEDFFLPPTDIYLWLSNGSQVELGFVSQPFCLMQPYPHRGGHGGTVLLCLSLQGRKWTQRSSNFPIIWVIGPWLMQHSSIAVSLWLSQTWCPQILLCFWRYFSFFQTQYDWYFTRTILRYTPPWGHSRTVLFCPCHNLPLCKASHEHSCLFCGNINSFGWSCSEVGAEKREWKPAVLYGTSYHFEFMQLHEPVR